jgi:hypothetical protein
VPEVLGYERGTVLKSYVSTSGYAKRMGVYHVSETDGKTACGIDTATLKPVEAPELKLCSQCKRAVNGLRRGS